MIREENLPSYNQSKLIPEVGDTVQITPTGVKSRLDLDDHPLLKEAILKAGVSATSVAAAGDDQELSAAAAPAATSSSVWEDQQKLLIDWEKNLLDFVSKNNHNQRISASSNAENNDGAIASSSSTSMKPMVFPKSASEVLKAGQTIHTVLKPGQRGIVNLLFTMTKKTKKNDDAMTFAFAEDASPATTEDSATPAATGNIAATTTTTTTAENESEWDFTSIKLFEHPNYTARWARLRKAKSESKNVTQTKAKEDNDNENDNDDEASKKKSCADDAAAAAAAATTTPSFSTLVFLSEDRLKVHVERDRKIIRDLEANEGRYLFNLVRLDNLLFGMIMPVIDYDILMCGETTSNSNSSNHQNNNNNNNNNAPSFLVRSFIGQRVALRPPSEDENLKRFKAESKLSYPELMNCEDPNITNNNNNANNTQENNNNNTILQNIYYSTTSSEAFSKIVSSSNHNQQKQQQDQNIVATSSNNNTHSIYGTIVEVRRHVKFATQFVGCVLVDAPNATEETPFSHVPLFSSFLRVSPTVPRFFVACHSSEVLPLPPSPQQQQQHGNAINNNNNNKNNTTSSENDGVVSGSKRRERKESKVQSSSTNNNSKEEQSKQAAPKTPANSAAAAVVSTLPATTTIIAAGVEAASSPTTNSNNNNNNNKAPATVAGATITVQHQDFQKLLKAVYGVDVASADEAARIVADGVPEKQETYNAHVFRSKFFSRNPTTVLKSALTLHNCLIGSQSGGGQFRRMYGTGIGAWALNNMALQQQQQQQQQQASPSSPSNNNKQQNSSSTTLTNKSQAAKMFG